MKNEKSNNFMKDAPKLKHKSRKWIYIFSFIMIPVIAIVVSIYSFVLPLYLAINQHAEFFLIASSIELFNSEFETYPPSDGLDPNGVPYCGAMKLAEVIVGKDLLGIHPDSVFRNDGKDPNDNSLYDISTASKRKGPYIPVEKANAFRLNEIFKNSGSFNGTEYVISDMFRKKRSSGKKTGMPILYYKADTTKSSHDVNNPDNPDNIYNYKDNYDLLALGVPGKPGMKHPLYEDPSLFYIMTKDYNITGKSTPVNIGTYILIAAGKDGLYGTPDDITNFNFKWRPKENINK